MTIKRPGHPMIATPSAAGLDVRSIRLGSRHIGATQQSFSDAIGVPVKTLRNWEQRRRTPTGPARVLLSLIARDPWIVFDVSNDQRQ
jgi:putative transcriptional regulator